MVRRKIEIEYIEDASKRHVAFTKRRKGLFGKTVNFCNKFDGVGAAIAISKAGNVYGIAHPHIDNVLSRYRAESKENDVVVKENLSSEDVKLMEAQQVVSEAMKRGQVEMALKNLEFAVLDGLEKGFKGIFGDTVARRREEELRLEEGHSLT